MLFCIDNNEERFKTMGKIYRYETHLHTSPVSKCGKVSVRENLEFYKELGYDGVFITNHFLDGNLNMSHSVLLS